MFGGEKINVTENRAVLHTALRQPPKPRLLSMATTSFPQVHEVLDRMAEFANRDPLRRLEGRDRAADPECGQYRDRRLGSRAGHGLRGAAALLRAFA